MSFLLSFHHFQICSPISQDYILIFFPLFPIIKKYPLSLSLTEVVSQFFPRQKLLVKEKENKNKEKNVRNVFLPVSINIVVTQTLKSLIISPHNFLLFSIQPVNILKKKKKKILKKTKVSLRPHFSHSHF